MDIKSKFSSASVIVIVVLMLVILYQDKVNFTDEIAKQDLVLRCEELYSVKSLNLEKTRYGKTEAKDALIWSPKTKSCLAYYNVYQEKLNKQPVFLFEVWDYTNDDLVLAYKSHTSGQCLQAGFMTDFQMFTYKYNEKLNGVGCGFDLREKGKDLLTNFEIAMAELGFKK